MSEKVVRCPSCGADNRFWMRRLPAGDYRIYCEKCDYCADDIGAFGLDFKELPEQREAMKE